MSRACSHASSSLRNVSDGSTRTGRQTSTSQLRWLGRTIQAPSRTARGASSPTEVPVFGDAGGQEAMLKLLKVHRSPLPKRSRHRPLCTPSMRPAETRRAANCLFFLPFPARGPSHRQRHRDMPGP